MKSKENTKTVKKRQKNLCKAIDIKERKRNNTLDTRTKPIFNRAEALHPKNNHILKKGHGIGFTQKPFTVFFYK